MTCAEAIQAAITDSRKTAAQVAEEVGCSLAYAQRVLRDLVDSDEADRRKYAHNRRFWRYKMISQDARDFEVLQYMAQWRADRDAQ